MLQRKKVSRKERQPALRTHNQQQVCLILSVQAINVHIPGYGQMFVLSSESY